MRAADVMSVDVYTATPDTPINEIALKLCDRNISAMPVVDRGNRVLGVVSEGDLLRRVELGTDRRSWWLRLLSSSETLAVDYVKTHGRTAKDVMTRPAIVVEESTDLAEIARLLDAKRIKRVPVVNDGKLVGIVSRADIIRGLIVAAKHWGRPRTVDDDKIREAIFEEFRRMPFAVPCVNVIVDEGEVHLWGPAETPERHAAIRVAAENVRGVRQVMDHMVDWKAHDYV